MKCKEKTPRRAFLCSLHLIGEGGLAVVNLDNLVGPVVEQTILDFAGGEAVRQFVLANCEDVLHSQSGVRDSGQNDGLCLSVGVHLCGGLRGGLLILRADVLNRGGQVDGVVVLHEVVIQSGDGVLLHSCCPFWFGEFPSPFVYSL